MKNFILVVLLLCSSFAVFGQMSMEEKATMMTHAISDVVSASEGQYKQIYDINMEYLVSESNIKSRTRQDYLKKKELNEARMTSISKILTKEQRAKVLNLNTAKPN